MRLKKTDRRYNLYRYGFDCYVEFASDDWNNWNRYSLYCKQKLGKEFWEFSHRVFTEGNYKCVPYHRNNLWSSKRIYFRGEKYYTLLMMAMPLEDKNTFYL